MFSPCTAPCSPWYKQAAEELHQEGIRFGAMDMDGPGKQYGPRYGVSGMPHIMAFIPGQSEPVGMQGLGGAPSIINFAKEQWDALSCVRLSSVTSLRPPYG
eukprot:SAG31_NODE_106_length_24954_cov_17.726413_11_plen_101_part_00